jgi:HAD superfamily hydrolase (TIGR01509 family)
MVTRSKKARGGGRMPGAVLFDFDGVIADTENVHVAAWERTFAAMGWTVSPETCVRAAEVDDRVFLAEVFARRKIVDGDIEGWVRRKQAVTVSILSGSPRLCQGAEVLVRRLRGKARLAVVSCTWRQNIETVLRTTGLESYFELAVVKEDVDRVKPDPAAYVTALERLGVEPMDAVALEDSATGMHSAHAAGVRCVVVGKGGEAPGWVGPAPYVPDLGDVDAVLRALALP